MKVLLTCDDKRYRERIKECIGHKNTAVAEADSLSEAKKCLEEDTYDVLICTVPILSYADPHYVLNQLKEKAQDACHIIFLARHLDMPQVIRLVKAGLSTCLSRAEELPAYLEQLPATFTATPATAVKRPPISPDIYVKGISAEAREMYKQIDLVAPTDLSVIIYGETGTGKESVAHRLAMSRGATHAPYITLDCGCLSRELAASELFGCTKGAFTGAHEAKTGAFEEANGGTLFLDEIGNLDLEVQTYLLRALQERKIRKVGGQKETEVQVRIIVASNESLQEAVKKGHFREDLYHRLNEFEIIIPPLRQRTDDIPVFINRFLDETNQQLGKNVAGLQPEVLELFMTYSWPGNIRELKNIIRRACLLTPDDQLVGIESLPMDMVLPDSSLLASDAEAAGGPATAGLKSTSYRAELEHIATVLRQVNYNKTKAAALLNIDRKTLYNKLKKFPHRMGMGLNK